MPYKHEWYLEGQILSAELWGNQTVDELKESNAAILHYLENADDRLIHIIMNDENLENVPLSIGDLRKTLTYATHPNLGWVIMIGDKEKKIKDTAQDFLVTLLAKITRARYTRLKTLQEAIEYLKQVDPTITWATVKDQ